LAVGIRKGLAAQGQGKMYVKAEKLRPMSYINTGKITKTHHVTLRIVFCFQMKTPAHSIKPKPLADT
jgi:hypothetical protein